MRKIGKREREGYRVRQENQRETEGRQGQKSRVGETEKGRDRERER